ncbi:MAG: carbohydrate ABC transporter permease, partial [Lachnospiraceae bacterium]|nr:carbohydrate ABC transporter permease [Lachnospiraceae bacterium]
MKIKQSKYTRIFNILSYTIITITAIICVLPFLIIISGSLSDNGIVVQEGYSLFPKQFTLDAYKYIFE